MRINKIWHRVRFLFFWSLTGVYLFAALGLVSEEQREMICNRIEVMIADSVSRQFVKREDIVRQVMGSGIPILGVPVNKLEIYRVEDLVSGNPFIRSAEVYKTIGGILTIQIRQREPIIRIMKTNARDFYIDREGFIVPFNGVYPSYVLVANGAIPEPTGHPAGLYQVFEAGDRWNELYRLARFIEEDDLWKQQIEQIYVKQNGDMELVPRVGAHLILLGKPDKLEEKFNRLEILYGNGFGQSEWNKYEQINIKYDNQVICTKR